MFEEPLIEEQIEIFEQSDFDEYELLKYFYIRKSYIERYCRELRAYKEGGLWRIRKKYLIRFFQKRNSLNK